MFHNLVCLIKLFSLTLQFLQVIDYFSPSTYNYLLGKSILVAPIISNDTTAFKVDLPKGDTWVYWWNHSIICKGGSSFHFNGSIPLDEFPVFFVNGKLLERISLASNPGWLQTNISHASGKYCVQEALSPCVLVAKLH